MSLSVTNSLSIRVYYHDYPKLITGSTRRSSNVGTLSMADSSALRNAIRKLQDYKFDDNPESQNQEKLKAFTDIVNNTISSATKYGTNDSSVKNAASTIKKLNAEYEKELNHLGISVNKDGTLDISDSAAKNIKTEKFSKFFSKDSKYLNSLYDAAKKITRKVDVRI
ncbi:MAG: hypothetical protein K5769_07745 [Pseudobutyrivibrio sp.]|nr:hypothetical protein [Pseudobutyrivibrio sp.]